MVWDLKPVVLATAASFFGILCVNLVLERKWLLLQTVLQSSYIKPYFDRRVCCLVWQVKAPSKILFSNTLLIIFFAISDSDDSLDVGFTHSLFWLEAWRWSHASRQRTWKWKKSLASPYRRLSHCTLLLFMCKIVALVHRWPRR